MAVELLRSQVQYLEDQTVAREQGGRGPPMLSTQREPHHDLESLLWVLVYSMMIHNYNSLTSETDRMQYKVLIDRHFGHGSTETIIEKRQAMYLAHSRVGWNSVSRWFPDPRERKFFTRCMKLIAEHDKEEEEEEDLGPFAGEIDDNNPAIWGPVDLGTDEPSDEDTSKSETYIPGGSRKRPPVITYQRVVAILESSIKRP